MVASLTVFAALFIPYLPDGAERIWTRVLSYTSWTGYYGLQLWLPRAVNGVVFYGVLFALPLLVRQWKLIDALIVQTTAFFLLSYGMGNNLFVVLLFIYALQPSLYGIVLSVAAFPSLFSPVFVASVMNAVWWALVGVVVHKYRR